MIYISSGAGDENGLNYRTAVAGHEILSPEDVARTIFRAAHRDDLHYPVGVLSGELIEEISPRQEPNRRMWRQIHGIAERRAMESAAAAVA